MIKNVLLVDDDQSVLNVVCQMLADVGLVLHCVDSAEAALCEFCLREKQFHLLITDYNLPGLDGVTLANKTLEITPYMPIIMLTGNSVPEVKHLALGAGVKRVLFKPFTRNELLDSVEFAMNMPLPTYDNCCVT